jgi:hypothetical protein
LRSTSSLAESEPARGCNVTTGWRWRWRWRRTLQALTAIDAQIKEDEMAGWWHEQKIRERAYEIWERAGHPEGRSVEHWQQAEAEIVTEEQEFKEEVELEAEGVV